MDIRAMAIRYLLSLDADWGDDLFGAGMCGLARDLDDVREGRVLDDARLYMLAFYIARVSGGE